MQRFILLLTGCLLLASAAPVARKSKIKLASIFPEGSVWDQSLRQMGSDWKSDTSGEVSLKVYAGGVAGDEPDIVRKMRIGQLQAACLTVSGLAEIDESFAFFEIPLFFDSYDEVFHIVDELETELSERLAEKGFVLIHWGHGGWIHLFSKKPVHTVEDLKALKQFTWAGDALMENWWRDNGFRPVPLAATDIPTGLQTGLIEVVPATPLAALSLQWFRSTPYMLDHGFLPFLGATVMTKKAYDKLSESEREAVMKAAQKAEAYLLEQVPEQERAAIAEMKKRGVESTELQGGVAPWEAAARSFVDKMKDVMPAGFFERALAARKGFRERGQ